VKPIRRTVEMRYGMAYYHGKFLGHVLDGLRAAFDLPYNGEFSVTIKAEARRIANENSSEGNIWGDRKRVMCKKLYPVAKSELILNSFNAG